MTDIGEEAQLDIRHLLLHFHFLAQAVVHTHEINGQTDDERNDGYIEHERPPCQPPRTRHIDHQLLLIIHIRSFPVGRTHTEDILAVPQVTIGHTTHIPRIIPFIVQILHLIGIEDLIRSDIIHRCILDGDVTAVCYTDGIAFQFLHLHLDARDMHRGH